MAKLAGESLQKVTLNLYTTDVAELQRLYGWGWSERVRDLVREHIQSKRAVPKTIEDIIRHG